MAKPHKPNYPALDALSLGYEGFQDMLQSLSSAYDSINDYPQYDIKKPDDRTYLLVIAVPGFSQDQLHSYIESDFLHVQSVAPADPAAGSYDYFHQGINAGALDCRFLLHPKLKLDWTHFEDGELSFHFTDSTVDTPRTEIAIGEVHQAGLAVQYDSTGSPISVTSVPVSGDTVVVNADDHTTPTTEVVLPDVLPQVVQVSVDNVAPSVDPANTQPQATFTVTPATDEVKADDVTTAVVKTDPGSSDVVVAVPTAVVDAMTDKGIDVMKDVTTAIASSDLPAPVAPEAPPATANTDVPVAAPDGSTTATVTVPDVVPQVVEVKVADPVTPDAPPVVSLEPVATDIPEDHTVTPIVTAPGSPDMVATVSPDTQTKMDAAGVTLDDVTKAVVQADPTVLTVDAPVAPSADPTPAPAPDPAPADVPAVAPAPVLADVPPAPPPADATVVHADDPTTPTVAVSVPDPLPQVVEVSATPVSTAPVDPANTAPQMTLTVSDATQGVSTDNVVTSVIATPDHAADVVVAVPADLHAALADQGIDVANTVATAVAAADPQPPALPVVDPNAAAPVAVTVSATDAAPNTAAVNDNNTAPVIEVVTPPVVTPVMALDPIPAANGVPAVELTDTSHEVDPSATLIPVATPDGQANVVIAVNPDVHQDLADRGIDVAAAVQTALANVNVTATATGQAPVAAVDPAAVAPDANTAPSTP